MNKKERLAAICSLVEKKRIDTQEDLVDELRQAGFAVTQATISRDIKELGIVKIPTEDTYIYALPETATGLRTPQSVLEVKSMDNLLTITVVPGATAVLKRQILERFKEAIFSIIADDDSLLIVAQKEADLGEMQEVIRAW